MEPMTTTVTEPGKKGGEADWVFLLFVANMGRSHSEKKGKGDTET